MLKILVSSAAALALGTTALLADQLRAFDVAEDVSKFVYDNQHVFEDGMPAYGNSFITQGYIYPAGTLDGGIEGTNADGSPAFPDLVLGTWTCDGVFVGKGMRTETGTILISRQVFEFADGSIIVTQGSEKIDANVSFDRVIVGGTGDYAELDEKVMQQILLGMSDGYGVRLQLAIGDNRRAAVDDANTWDPSEDFQDRF